jgi:chromosome segregation ATPase
MILAWLLKPRNLAIVIVIVAVLGLGASTLYYKNKANRLAKELEAIRTAAKIAEDNLKETKDNIDKRIVAIQEESRKREQEEKKKAEKQRKELEGQLANKEKLIKNLDSQLNKVSGELDEKKKELGTATGEYKAALQKKVDELEQAKIQMAKEREGLVCLDKNVPNNMVRTLNEVLNK